MSTHVDVNLSRLRNIEKMFDFSKAMIDECAVVADSRWSAQAKGQFASEGASTGAAWAPLSPRYLAQKQARRAAGRAANTKRIAAYRGGRTKFLKLHVPTSTRILVDTGVMRQAYNEREAPDHIAEGVYLSPTRGLIHLGARGPGFYKIHVWGTRHMPVRNPLRRTSRQMEHIFDGIRAVVRAHFRRALRARNQAGY